MKKLYIITLVGLFILSFTSCKRDAADTPGVVGGPAGSRYVMDGSANPSVIFVDGNVHTSKITVKVTDFKGNPIAGKYIYLELRHIDDPDNTAKIILRWWGYFSNGYTSIRKRTNGNGTITATYYGPELISIPTLGNGILIKATMEEPDESELFTMPFDFIHIVFIRQGEE